MLEDRDDLRSALFRFATFDPSKEAEKPTSDLLKTLFRKILNDRGQNGISYDFTYKLKTEIGFFQTYNKQIDADMRAVGSKGKAAGKGVFVSYLLSADKSKLYLCFMQGTNRFLGLGNKDVDKKDLGDFFSMLTAECRDN